MVSTCAAVRVQAMSLVSAAILSFGPVLVAIVAAALILPGAWLATYAGFVIVAAIIYADYSGRYEDAALRASSQRCSA
jgi:hypothetical protein